MPDDTTQVSKREFQWAVGAATAVMLLTCVPYLIVWWTTPSDGVFPWILFNSDDHGVYFAWMRQAHDGHFLFRNLFTTEPQRGVYFHLYFLLLGWLSRLPGLDIPLAYHLGRLLFGALTLVLVYRLAAFATESVFARKCAFWTVALSGGFGWLIWTDKPHPSFPVDVWQPEALTFPSLYTNGLFCVSLALMLGVVICLLLAERNGPKWAVGAGLCGLALGNIHSYDVIHLTVVWVMYLGGRWALEGAVPMRALRMALLAAMVAAPSVAYMAWLYLTEPVFKARADTATWSQLPTGYLLGFGLLGPLAFFAGRRLLSSVPPTRRDWMVHGAVAVLMAVIATGLYVVPGGQLRPLIALLPLLGWAGTLVAIRRVSGDGGNRTTRMASGYDESQGGAGPSTPNAIGLLLAAWVLGGIAAAYLPFAFQRKMIMGTHLPLGILAGLAVASFAEWKANASNRRGTAVAVALGVIGLLSLSSVRYLIRDVSVAYRDGTTSTGAHPVYWDAGDVHAWQWLSAHSTSEAALLSFPLRGVLAPAYSGRRVYAGHWGETPDFAAKVRTARDFYAGAMSSGERRRFLRENHLTHVQIGPVETMVMTQRVGNETGPLLSTEPFLRPVFTEGKTTLYEVAGP